MAKHDLPDDLFHLVTALFPDLIRISEASEIKAIELFTLWYLKHKGATNNFGQRVLLRSQLTRLLQGEVGFSAGVVDQHLDRMEEKGLVIRTRISTMEKKKLFNTSSGRRGVVALLPKGGQKIDDIKEGVNKLFQDTVAKLPAHYRLAVRASLPTIASIAKTILSQTTEAERPQLHDHAVAPPTTPEQPPESAAKRK